MIIFILITEAGQRRYSLRNFLVMPNKIQSKMLYVFVKNKSFARSALSIHKYFLSGRPSRKTILFSSSFRLQFWIDYILCWEFRKSILIATVIIITFAVHFKLYSALYKIAGNNGPIYMNFPMANIVPIMTTYIHMKWTLPYTKSPLAPTRDVPHFPTGENAIKEHYLLPNIYLAFLRFKYRRCTIYSAARFQMHILIRMLLIMCHSISILFGIAVVPCVFLLLLLFFLFSSKNAMRVFRRLAPALELSPKKT